LVEHSTHSPKIDDSNPAAGIKRRKNEIKLLLCRKKLRNVNAKSEFPGMRSAIFNFFTELPNLLVVINSLN
jgi:hypothetical protein